MTADVVVFDPQAWVLAGLDELVRVNGGIFEAVGCNFYEQAQRAGQESNKKRKEAILEAVKAEAPSIEVKATPIPSRMTPNRVINATCVVFNVSRDELMRKTRRAKWTARRKALVRVLIDRCWPEYSVVSIAALFCMDHSSIQHLRNTWRADRHGDMTRAIERELGE